MLPIGRAAVVLLLLAAQRNPSPPAEENSPEARLPSGKSQKREILKADFEKSKADAAALLDLAEQLNDDLEKDDAYVLNLRALKKAEDIEKLAKRIKDRMKRQM
jgi:hypothetical protein